VASATRNGRRLIAVVLGSWSGAVRAQKAAQLLERGFNSGGLSWLTPSLGTVDALAPIDAQPPNLREEMCGGHRRKPPSEENEEEPEDPAAAAANNNESGNGQAFMLSNAKPAKFVLGPPVETTPPTVVFTGPADRPDTVEQTASATPKKKKKVAAKPDAAEKPAKAAKTEDAKAAKAAKAAKTAKPAKPAKPKVSSTTQ
jgi:D-alanyl-D-alanine carboxypeptidase